MAIRTEPTQQRIPDKARSDSGIHDSRITTRVPIRSGSAPTSPLPNLTAERTTGRLRPVSPSIHDTVVPDRKPGTSSDVLRKISPAEFNVAMSHFYRGEVQRSNTWRSRLDNTTYWAVLTVAGALSFAFSSPNNPHFLIPIISILVAIFLFIFKEAAPMVPKLDWVHFFTSPRCVAIIK